MEKIIIILLLTFSLCAQDRKSDYIIKNDSLNAGINPDTLTVITPNIDFPFRYEIFLHSAPSETSNEDTNYAVELCNKWDIINPVWVSQFGPGGVTPTGHPERIEGYSLGGRVKVTVFKNDNANNIGFYTRVRIQWIRCIPPYGYTAPPTQ